MPPEWGRMVRIGGDLGLRSRHNHTSLRVVCPHLYCLISLSLGSFFVCKMKIIILPWGPFFFGNVIKQMLLQSIVHNGVNKWLYNNVHSLHQSMVQIGQE